MNAPDFLAVDKTGSAVAAAFLDLASSLPDVRYWKQFSFDELAPEAGHRILDVGCGTGTDAVELARRVGSRGHITGVDLSHKLVAIAAGRASEEKLPLRFIAADIHDLPFESGTFDRTRIDRVLHFLSDPSRAIAEVVRVTAAGGRIVVTEPDWSTLEIHGGDPELTARVLTVKNSFEPGKTIGSKVAEDLTNLGLGEVRATRSALALNDLQTARTLFGIDQLLFSVLRSGAITAIEARTWYKSLIAAEENGRLSCRLGGTIVAAAVPVRWDGQRG